MEIKLFGKSLFEVKKNKFWAIAQESNKVSKFLPDFYQRDAVAEEYSDMVITQDSNGNPIFVSVKKGKKKKVQLTPKGVFELKLLNEETFKINTEKSYVDEQLSNFKDKLNLIKSAEHDMRNGALEIQSVIMRLENRKKYSEVKDVFEEYPYTTTEKIKEVIKNHDNLKLGQVEQFLADMPKEAVDAMKHYNTGTQKLCGKQAVFYIIADKKDFKKSDSRRDPILLAQSPFGHFWQILGAWDQEMLFLPEL